MVFSKKSMGNIGVSSPGLPKLGKMLLKQVSYLDMYTYIYTYIYIYIYTYVYIYIYIYIYVCVAVN